MSKSSINMPNFSVVATIFRKEIRAYFNSAVAYVLIVAFLAYLAYAYINNIFLVNVASMRDMFDSIPIILLIIIPALTMRLIAEENRSGTIELLTTKPVTDSEIILGKFFAAWVLTLTALLPTVFQYITITSLGDLDQGTVFAGYFGLILLSAVFCAFGVLASSMTSGQIVAFILGFIFLFVLFEINKIVFFVPEAIAPVIEFIGIDYHYSNIARGVIDSRDVIYMLSAGGFALYMSVVSLGRRKW